LSKNLTLTTTEYCVDNCIMPKSNDQHGFSHILLIVGIVAVGIVGLGVIGSRKNAQIQKDLKAYAQEAQALVNDEAITNSAEIIEFVNQVESCPSLSPHDEDLSKQLIMQVAPSGFKANKFPQLDFTKIPLFILDGTLYFAKVNYDTSADMDLLEQISPKLAQKVLACYFEDRHVPLLPNFMHVSSEEHIKNVGIVMEKSIDNIEDLLEDIGDHPTGDMALRKKELESALQVRKKKLEGARYQIGAFAPPEHMVLVISDTHNSDPNRYVATLIHEYVHFVSYQSNGNLERFWYDGLADYFTREIMEKVGRTYATSYIVPVQLVTEMTKDIPEEKLQELLFSNDQAAVERLMDATYGKGFYEKHRANFESTITTDTKKAERVAEPIFKDIRAIR